VSAQASAQSAVDVARLELAAAVADRDFALLRLSEVRNLAEDAATRSERSTRALATLVRAMAQGSDSSAVEAVLGAADSADLLARLGVVDRLSSLTGNMSEIRDRVERDRDRARQLQDELSATESTSLSFPVDEKQAVLAAAELSLSTTTQALAAASLSAQAVLGESAQAATSRSEQATSQLAGRLGARLSTQGWAVPAVGIVTDGFGARPDLPLPGVQPFHSGTDIGAACGSPVYAATAGVVAQTGRLGTYGNWILIDHGEGIATGYAHLQDGSTLVGQGDTVVAGQLIAGVGSTGLSTGCHLHVEVRVGGSAIDPLPFFAERGIGLGTG